MRLSQPSIDALEIDAVTRVLQSEFLGMGKEVIEFEEELTTFFSNPAVCVNTGTSALQLALSASGISKGDEVLVPSLTYVATYQAISATGGIPISCDVQEDDLQIDVEDAATRITKKTKAIVPVYVSGATNCLNRVKEFAQKNNLINIADAAHAFGSMNQKQRIGSDGGTYVFSLDGIKNITSGEGGLVVSNDNHIINHVRNSRLLGVIGDSEMRAIGERSWNFEVENQGWRYHMSDLFAAIGKVQLSKFQEFSRTRKQLYEKYLIRLKNCHQISVFNWNVDDGMVPHIFLIRIPGMRSRNILRSSLSEDGIPTGVHYKPNHLLKFFKDSSSAPLFRTEKIYPEILSLPFHVKLTESDIDEIVAKLEKNLELAFE